LNLIVVIIISIFIYIYFLISQEGGPNSLETVHMNHKNIAIVTGANRGIGFEVSKQLATKGLGVILTSKNETNGKEAVKLLQTQGLKDIWYHVLDVSSKESIKEFTSFIHKHHTDSNLVLINNAGVYNAGWNEKLFQNSMDTNCLGPALLTNELLPIMKRNSFGRIVYVSSGYGKTHHLSPTYKKLFDVDPKNTKWEDFISNVTFDPNDLSMKNGFVSTYKLSKACGNFFVQILGHQLNKEGSNIFANAVDPGWAKTRMGGVGASVPVDEAADTIVWLSTQTNSPQGGFFFQRKTTSWE